MTGRATSNRVRQLRLGPLWITHSSGGWTICFDRFYVWPRSNEKRWSR